ncbi:MAG: hypothetical protein J6O72_02330 [Lachnospira sp.]|nr:hypothetical protein [Lachnospira sp.]
MDTMELFHILYIVFLIFAILLLVAAAFEFFAFRIKKVFQDLTGITRKREIKQMTEDTEYTGQLKHRSTMKKRDMAVSPSGRLKGQKTEETTGKLRRAGKKAVITPPPKPVTEDIKITERIPVKEEEVETGVLNTSAAETDVLNKQVLEERERESETSVLSEREQTARRDIHFLLERQILMTHTDEVIDM